MRGKGRHIVLWNGFGGLGVRRLIEKKGMRQQNRSEETHLCRFESLMLLSRPDQFMYNCLQGIRVAS